MKSMGVVKALATKKSWGQVAHTDKYLRGELEKQKEQGIEKTQENLYSADNANRDNFTKSLIMTMKQHDKNPTIKAYEYVQSFSKFDKENGLTPEKVHQLGEEYCKEFYSGYPYLVVTHTDTENYHNQIIVGNINVNTGKSYQCSPQELTRMKEYTGQQCEKEGFTRSIYTNERTQKSLEKQMTNDEHMMIKQGKITQKDELTQAIREEIPKSKSLEELQSRLKENGIDMRIRGSNVSFHYPDWKENRYVRGSKLAPDLGKEQIENAIKQSTKEYTEPTREYSELENELREYATSTISREQSVNEWRNQFGYTRNNENAEYSQNVNPGEKGNGLHPEPNGQEFKSAITRSEEITRRYKNFTAGSRESYQSKLKDLLELRNGLSGQCKQAGRELAELRASRNERTEKINKLTTERSQIPSIIRGNNEKITRNQSQGYDLSR